MDSPLAKKKTNLIALAGKSVFGAVPVIGPLLVEIVGLLIPDQRIERIESYLTELGNRLSEVEETSIRTALNDPNVLALAEDGFTAASRAITKERIAYIASIVANGLSKEDINANRQRYLLNLLSELNDEEILWLRYFLNPTLGGDQEFRTKHKEVLNLANDSENASESELDKSAIQKSYGEHLLRLMLIQNSISLKDTGLPGLDKTSEAPRISYTFTTHLGRMLLRQIDLIDSEAVNEQKQADR